MQSPSLTKPVFFLLFMILLFTGLYFARTVLIPFTLAGVLAMLLTPLCEKMEKWVNKGIASLACIVLLIAFIGGIVLLLNWQLGDLASDLDQAEKQITETVTRFREYISNTLGIGPEQQKEMIQKQSVQGASAGKVTAAVVASLLSMGVDAVLVIVYVFMFLCSRGHLRNFVLKLVPGEDKTEATAMIGGAVKMTGKYLGGLAMMIGMLWVMYGIGFSIAGVKNALFFAVLCGLLEIIPFVGNLAGTTLTVIMVIVQGGGTGMILGVLGVYLLVQFVQTYILEPMVVGSEVNLNPLFTILAIVVWESVWGIAGMFLAIPVTGVIKIVFDHVGPLKAYGFLMGKEKKVSSGKQQ